MNHYLPVSIMKIAKDMGFRVIEKAPKNDDIAAIIRDENDGAVQFIYVNKTLPSPRKRFLIALALCYYKMDAFPNEKYYKRVCLTDHPEEEMMIAAMHMLVPAPLLEQILLKEENIKEKLDMYADALDVEVSVLKYRIHEMRKRKNR